MSEIDKQEEVQEETQEQQEPLQEEVQEEEAEDASESEQPANIDHKAELEKLRKDREKALEFAKSKDIEAKRLKHELDEYRGESSITKEDIEEIISQREQSLRRDLTKSQAQNLVRTLSSDESEIEHVMFHLNNTIVRTDDIEKDVQRAYAVANANKIMQMNELAKRTIASARSKSQPSMGGQKQKTTPNVKLSDREKKLLDMFGVKPNDLDTQGGKVSYKRS